MKQDGFSLIELLTVMIILGIVAGLGTVSFTGWVRKYNLENQVKEIYADLQSVRLKAMDQNRSQFLTLAASRLRAYEDTSPAPWGDGNLTVGSDAPLCIWSRETEGSDPNCSGGTSLSFKDLKYPVTWNGSGTLDFNARGLGNSSCTICIYSSVNPSYDCLVVSATRIRMGKLTTQGVCSSANCVIKK
jgi:prepilin-type N-terminal cleavage/methylation domain-containing protein